MKHKAASAEVLEALISRPPGMMLRSGTGLIAMLLSLLIGFAACIRYPDTVVGEAVITSSHPPVPLQGVSGEIERLLVTEGDTVQAEEIVAVVSQDLPVTIVDQLQRWVCEAKKALSEGKMPTEPPRPPVPLGDLQASHAAVVTAWHAQQLQQSHALSSQDRAAAQQRLHLLGLRSMRLQRQDSLLAEKLGIARNLYEADSMLWSKGSAAWLEVQASRDRMLSAQEAYDEARAGILDRDLLASATAQDIQRLGLEQYRNDYSLQNILWQSLVALENALQQWEDRHLLRAPFAGVLAFDRIPALGQQLVAGETFGWLVPLHAGPRVARVRIPGAGAGEVAQGQQVLISLADFPRAEYGVLTGRVAHVAPLLIAGQYHIDVSLPADLRTSAGSTLLLRNEAVGRADIVTRERSLLSRTFEHLVRALQR